MQPFRQADILKFQVGWKGRILTWLGGELSACPTRQLVTPLI